MFDLRCSTAARRKADCHALLDVEDILVHDPFRRFLDFCRVSMEVQNAKTWERGNKTLSHPTKCWIIEVTVVRDKAEDADTCVLNSRLGLTNEFHVVVLQPKLLLI